MSETLEVYVLLVEPMDANSYVENVYVDSDKAKEKARTLREHTANAAVSLLPYEVAVPTFTTTLQRANQYGSMKGTVPQDIEGWDGETPAIGDKATLALLAVTKQGDEE